VSTARWNLKEAGDKRFNNANDSDYPDLSKHSWPVNNPISVIHEST